MRLEQVNGKSKKTGKPYTAYRVAIGKYKSPIFFPSEIELDYIKQYIKETSHQAFADSDEDDIDA